MKINGKLSFDASGVSVIENLRVEKAALASRPVWQASDAGRLFYATDTQTLFLGGSSNWIIIGTGGDAATIQFELDQLELALGGLINSNGTFNATGATFSHVSSPTSITNVLTQLDAAIGGSTLDQIFPQGNVGDLIYKATGPTWATAAPGATTGVQPYDLELTALAGLTSAANKLPYFTGSGTAAVADFSAFGRTLVASADAAAVRTSLALVPGTNVQAYDSDLASIAALAPTASNFLVGNGTGYDSQTPAQVRTTLGLVIGTNVQAYDADLAQIAAFTPAANTFMIGNGGAEGARYTMATASAARTAMGLGDIATLNAASFIRTDGTSTVTANVSLGGFRLTNVGNATVGTDAINKNQLDAAVAGLAWKPAVRVATTGNISLSSAATGYDGVTLANGDRILVMAQTAPAENGIYVFNGSGAALTRATDMDTAFEFSGATVFVTEGTLYANSGWTQTAEVVTVGTTAVTWVQFQGSNLYTWGIGLSNSGNTVNVNLGAGITELATDGVGIDLYDTTGSALILTTNGTARSTLDTSKLALLINTSQLAQDTTGLYIKANGITASLLAADTAGNGLSVSAGGLSVNVDGTTLEITTDVLNVKNAGITNAKLSTGGQITLKANSGGTTEPMVLGEDLNFEVGAGTGVAVAVGVNNTVTISGVNATTSVKGVASFNSADFSVTSGAVSAVAKNIDSLTDVAVSSASTGDTLVYNGTNFVNRKVYFAYSSSAAANTHTVTHNLGQKYCVVTVVDNTDEVVIPQSIKFDTTNQLTVTFNTPIDCKVICVGV